MKKLSDEPFSPEWYETHTDESGLIKPESLHQHPEWRTIQEDMLQIARLTHQSVPANPRVWLKIRSALGLKHNFRLPLFLTTAATLMLVVWLFWQPNDQKDSAPYVSESQQVAMNHSQTSPPGESEVLLHQIDQIRDSYDRSLKVLEERATARLATFPPFYRDLFSNELDQINTSISNSEALLAEHPDEIMIHRTVARGYDAKANLLKTIMSTTLPNKGA
ncbi:MAG: hypothetical protein H6510_03090 [Acidobacteria bacterium]|nr:hypothetical protein [Acidobacteriota bacterium]MCB9396782.1 hypothetical protein [Acidobacteriota bacterium]